MTAAPSDPLQARDWALLRALSAGPLAPAELAAAAALPLALVGITAKRLADLGYLTVQRGEAGVRRVYALSAQGERALQAAPG
jgi:DNA-binding MarR family transcriptional regulator